MTLDVYRGRKTTMQQQQQNQFCSDDGPRVQNGPTPGGPGFDR